VVVVMAATAKAVLVRVEELSASEMMELPRVRDTFDHPNECVTVSGHIVNKYRRCQWMIRTYGRTKMCMTRTK
jgi:hypothetical protein